MVHDFTNGHTGIVDKHQVSRQYYDKHRANLLHKGLQPLVEERDAARLHLLVSALLLQGGLLRRLKTLTVE